MQFRAFASSLMIFGIIAIAAFLLVWGVLGMFEYVTGTPAVVLLQHPAYPAGLQFLQWTLLIAFGASFLIGYATRWPYTPLAVIVTFAMLAAMCFIQTFDFLTNDFRYLAFVMECIAYVVISIYLLRSERMRLRFGADLTRGPERAGM